MPLAVGNDDSNVSRFCYNSTGSSIDDIALRVEEGC